MCVLFVVSEEGGRKGDGKEVGSFIIIRAFGKALANY